MACAVLFGSLSFHTVFYREVVLMTSWNRTYRYSVGQIESATAQRVYLCYGLRGML
jgi:hypothetical protein